MMTQLRMRIPRFRSFIPLLLTTCLCLSISLTYATFTTSQIQNWAKDLGDKYNQVASDILRTDEYQQFLQDRYSNNEFDTLNRNGNQDIDNFANILAAIVQQKDGIIRDMQEEMEKVIMDYVRDDHTGSPEYIDSTKPEDIASLDLEDHPNFPEPVDIQHSAVRFAPGVSEDNQEIRDHLFISQDLHPIFRKHLDDTTWQYFGSQTGFFRQYPGREWSKDDRGRYTEFDARLRPWYVGSTSGPKDVLIVFDISGSMSAYNRMSIGRQALLTVLDTLTEKDFVNVILFDHRIEVPSCFPETLVRAIPRNINKLKAFVNSFGPRGGTDFRIAFEKAFEMLRESRIRNQGSFCETVILFMTDGIAPDPSDIINANRDSDTPVSIFSYSFGEEADDTVPRKIACENDGLFFKIPDGGDLRSSMGQYYQYFAAGIQNDQVFWTAPYFDASGLGLVITASIPLYDRRRDPPSLFGVVGTDVIVSELLLEAYSVSNDDSYAFVINREGQVLAHPSLKPPTDYTSPPVYIDISEVEQAQGFDDIRAAMLEGRSGEVRDVQVTRNIPAGDVQYEGVRQRTYQASYYYRPIPGSEFSVGLVLAIDDEDGYRWTTPSSSEFGSSIYHRLDLFASTYTLKTMPPPRNSNRGPLYYTEQTSAFKIAPRGFQEPFRYDNMHETPQSAEELTDLVNGETTPSDLRPRDDVLTSIRLSRKIEESWIESYNEDDMLWMYIGTENGMWRMYPGHNTTKTYDPVNRPWYLRAVASRTTGVTLSTPYQDASNPDIRVVTISKPMIMPTTEKIDGVMGLDYKYHAFAQELRDTVSVCTEQGYECYLVDQSGMLVVHNEFDVARVGDDVSNTFMGFSDSYNLNDLTSHLLSNDILVQEEYRDMQTLQKIKYFRFDTSNNYAFASNLNGCFGSAFYGVAAVPNTNLYLIVTSGQGSRQSICTNYQPSQDPLDVCSLKETLSFEICPDFSLSSVQLENLRNGACDGLDSDSDSSASTTTTINIFNFILLFIGYVFVF